jgi:hypothetical protein
MRIPILLSLFVALSLVQNVHAQSAIEITGQSSEYLFNDWMHFNATYDSNKIMLEGFVFYQFDGSDKTWVYEGEVSRNDTLDVSVDLDTSNSPPIFSTITYWYRLASDHGEIFESQRYTFYYEDNRFTWQTIDRAPFSLRYHAGDPAFAEAILSAAERAVVRAQALLPLPAPQNVNFLVYDNPADVQLVAQLAGFPWVAGHADPKYGRLLLSLAPGAQQSLEIERQVPHEVAHLMLYQALGPESYAHLPAWLNEGIAGNVELYSDPLSAQLLQLAYDSNALLPFFSLCQAFPQDVNLARLAYAQSASFVRYLSDTYNSTGFALLVDSYAGSDCATASVAAYGKDINALDAEWRIATFLPPNELQNQLESFPWIGFGIIVSVALVAWLVRRRAARPRRRK